MNVCSAKSSRSAEKRCCDIIEKLIDGLNGIIWSMPIIIAIVIIGIYFSIRLGFFQITHHLDMWKNIFIKKDSDSGISPLASFFTTMAMRIGVGNVAGVAIAIYNSGPGSLFWMWVIGFTNSALSFVECTLGQLYKTRIDNEYRCSSSFCIEKGLGCRWYGVLLTIVFSIGVSCFMPAAASYTISSAINSAAGIPMWISSLLIAIALGVIILGGIKRISDVASRIVPIMTVIYLTMTFIVIIVYYKRLPAVFGQIIMSAFGKDEMLWGGFAAAFQQGVKRGTFSSASGMGESIPAASAAETSHPAKQGLANAAGVFLDTIVICTCTGLMILLPDCFNTASGYNGSQINGCLEPGEQYIAAACGSIFGAEFGKWFVALIILLFSFTCIISYYYEAETAMLYLFKNDSMKGTRRIVKTILKTLMICLVFLYGTAQSSIAWKISDTALGLTTLLNMVMLLLLSKNAFELFTDYSRQRKNGEDPWFNPSAHNLDGVDIALWKDINKDYIGGL